MFHKKTALLGLALVILAAFARAETGNFTVSPPAIVFAYSEESFFLPKVTLQAGPNSLNINSFVSCIDGVDCLADFCSAPSKLFLSSGEIRKIQFECNLLKGESRLLGGRFSFNSDSNFSHSVEVFISKGTETPPIPVVGSVGIFGDLLNNGIFWILILAMFILFIIGVFTRNPLVIILFGISVFIFIFLFSAV